MCFCLKKPRVKRGYPAEAGSCSSALAIHVVTSAALGIRPALTNFSLITRPGVASRPYWANSARSVTFSIWVSTLNIATACRAACSTFLQLSQPGPRTLIVSIGSLLVDGSRRLESCAPSGSGSHRHRVATRARTWRRLSRLAPGGRSRVARHAPRGIDEGIHLRVGHTIEHIPAVASILD